MTCVSRWWTTAWVLGLAPWGLIRRGHSMSGEQGELSPGNMAAATLSMPDFCVVGLAKWESLWNCIELNWELHQSYKHSIINVKNWIKPYCLIQSFQAIYKEHCTFLVIWFYEMKISYQLSTISIPRMDIVLWWRTAFLCEVLPRHGMIVLINGTFPPGPWSYKAGLLYAVLNAWQSAAIPLHIFTLPPV